MQRFACVYLYSDKLRGLGRFRVAGIESRSRIRLTSRCVLWLPVAPSLCSRVHPQKRTQAQPFVFHANVLGRNLFWLAVCNACNCFWGDSAAASQLFRRLVSRHCMSLASTVKESVVHVHMIDRYAVLLKIPMQHLSSKVNHGCELESLLPAFVNQAADISRAARNRFTLLFSRWSKL